MKTKTGWIIAIGLGLVLLFFLPLLLMGGYGGMMGPGMMGGWGYANPLGFFSMLLMWLVPVGVVVLIVLGVAGLFNTWNNANRSNTSSVPLARTCQYCGKAARADWKTCPYCGQQFP